MQSWSRRKLLQTLVATGAAGFAAEAAAQGVKPEEAHRLPEWTIGSPDAKVIVVQYASLTCHHCQAFHRDVWPGIKERYVDTGKVRFIVREFPLDQLAMAGFLLARCAEGDRWYEIVDHLYKSGEEWAHAPNPGQALKAEALKLGFTAESYEACVTNQKLYDGILDVARRGSASGVTSTPTFFINGVKKVGSPSLAQFASEIEPLLK